MSHVRLLSRPAISSPLLHQQGTAAAAAAPAINLISGSGSALASPPPHYARPFSSSPAASSSRASSSSPAYAGHVPINGFQRSLLAVGSAVTSLFDPYRHDMVAVLGETTSNRQLPRMRDAMLKNAQSSEGRDILRDRPRLNTQTIDVAKLAAMPEGSFGRSYVDWLESCKVTPDTRDPVSPHLVRCAACAR